MIYNALVMIIISEKSKNNYSCEDLAKLSGLSRSTVHRIINQEVIPSIESADMLLRAVGYKLDITRNENKYFGVKINEND